MQENKNTKQSKNDKFQRVPKNTAAEVSKKFDVRTYSSKIGSSIGQNIRYRNRNDRSQSAPKFSKYTKTEILSYLSNPYSNETKLCDASVYLYTANSRYKRMIKYYSSLTDFIYYITLNSDAEIKDDDSSKQTIKENYNTVLRMLERFDVKSNFYKVITSAFKQDTYYGTFWIDDNAKTITLQELPREYCGISTYTDGSYDVDFNFSYFDKNSTFLKYFPKEFETKYGKYKKDQQKMKWQSLDVPNSFAIKVNDETPTYSTPPFSGVFPSLYDLSDYEALHLTKTELENYAILVMTLGTDKNGNWLLDFDKAKDFWSNLDDVLPEEVGSVLTPMPIDKISFKDSNVSDNEQITASSDNVWSTAGINASLFTKSNSASAMNLSVKNDQMITYMLVLQLQDVVNRLFRSMDFSKDFQINFINSSCYNETEIIKNVKDACTLGAPLVSLYCSLNGLSGSTEKASFLENDVLQIKDKFTPLESSYNASASDNSVGRPTAESNGDIIGDAGQKTDDNGSNDDKNL